MGWPRLNTILEEADRRFDDIFATIRRVDRRTLLPNLGFVALGLGIAASAVALAMLLSQQAPVLTWSGRDCTSVAGTGGALVGTDRADCLEGSDGNDQIYAEAGMTPSPVAKATTSSMAARATISCGEAADVTFSSAVAAMMSYTTSSPQKLMW